MSNNETEIEMANYISAADDDSDDDEVVGDDDIAVNPTLMTTSFLSRFESTSTSTSISTSNCATFGNSAVRSFRLDLNSGVLTCESPSPSGNNEISLMTDVCVIQQKSSRSFSILQMKKSNHNGGQFRVWMMTSVTVAQARYWYRSLMQILV
jgi:hypothetical protein